MNNLQELLQEKADVAALVKARERDLEEWRLILSQKNALVSSINPV